MGSTSVSSKNFKRFTVRLNERTGFIPDELYYKRIIAKAILFRRTEKIVSQQQFGGYRANIVTYTLAFLSYKTAQRIDLDKIWQEQGLSEALEENITEISKIVHQQITNPPGGANIGEWCKKQRCWDELKNTEYSLVSDLDQELIGIDRTTPVVSASSTNTQRSAFNVPTEEENEVIGRATSITAKTWYSLSKWAKETGSFQGWQRSIVFSVGQAISRGKKPTYKQAVQALIVYDEAINKGFQSE